MAVVMTQELANGMAGKGILNAKDIDITVGGQRKVLGDEVAKKVESKDLPSGSTFPTVEDNVLSHLATMQKALEALISLDDATGNLIIKIGDKRYSVTCTEIVDPDIALEGSCVFGDDTVLLFDDGSQIIF